MSPANGSKMSEREDTTLHRESCRPKRLSICRRGISMSSEYSGDDRQPQPGIVGKVVPRDEARSLQEGIAGQRETSVKPTSPEQQPAGFVRALGLFPATAINMSQMVGIGPFLTIPLMLTAMGGPQAMLGWVIGAFIAMADGLVWSEL